MLVGTQIALTIVLLTHASLLARNLRNLQTADQGLTGETVLAGYPFARGEPDAPLDAKTYHREALARVLAVPGVSAAAFTQFRPGLGTVPREPVGRAGLAIGDGDVPSEVTRISPGFFTALGIPIVGGRDFSWSDDERGRRVAIVSAHLARLLFGERSGLDERIRISTRPQLQNLRVVGIAGDARLFDIRGGNLAVAYVPALQSGSLAHSRFLVARAPTASSRGIRQAIESLGVETIQGMHTLSYLHGRALLQERLMAALASYFGGLALALAAAGVYGLLAYVVSLRRKEIGIRIALGADAVRVGRAVLWDGLRVACMGIAVGLGAAALSVPALRGVLVATSPYDPLAIGVACGVLLSVTLVASAAPALRAARVEPSAELRRD
jgi:hypothetical protein